MLQPTECEREAARRLRDGRSLIGSRPRRKTVAHKANPIPTHDPVFVARFRAKIAVQGDDACWPWIGAYRADGYGVIRYAGTCFKAHRVAYALTATLSRQFTIDHTCRNKGCVNPAHLEAVTQSVNTKRYQATRQPAVTCIRCGSPKTGKCRPCYNAGLRAWRNANRERAREISRRSYYKRKAELAMA